MKKKSAVVLVLFLAISFLLSGCMSAIKPMQPITKKLGSYPSANLFIVESNLVPMAMAASEMASLKTQLSVDILNKKIFKNFYNDSTTPAYLYITVQIVAMNKVDPAVRLLMGGLAGESRIEVIVTLKDAKTKAIVGQFSTEGRASGGSGALNLATGSGSIEEAIKYCVWNISGYLATNA